ncbi:MAG: arginyltransferase [Maricaulaceae bacterium]
MSRQFDPQSLQFYLTIPAPCPYLPGKLERKIFTQLDPLSGPQLNNYLTHAGFRRSQNVIYRPACETCRACQSLRVRVSDFVPGRRFRRILRQNKDITSVVSEAYATEEQFKLLKQYLIHRHPKGGMADMDFLRYEMMVEDGSANTEIVEYRDAENRLIACTLIDGLSDGKSMVYSFFDPTLKSRGLGNFMVLDQLDKCYNAELPYLYLGYWVANSPKMNYKKLFYPSEILTNRGWQELQSTDTPTTNPIPNPSQDL